MSEANYASLAEIAARMKLRALSEYAKLRRREASLTSKINDLAATVTLESGSVDQSDLSAVLALQRYASIASRQTDQLLTKQRGLSSDLELARRRAMQAHGRADAIEILAERQREEVRRRRARASERMMEG